MQGGPTFRLEIKREPTRTIRVEVISGPDSGSLEPVGGEQISIGTAQTNDLVLTDETVSRFHTQLSTHPNGVAVEDHGSTNGTRIGAAWIERGVVPLGTTIKVGKTEIRVTDGETVGVDLSEGDCLGQLLGRAPSMRKLMVRIQRAATTDVPVLLQGESGTGKELAAEALHASSKRADRPFVTVDCGSVSAELIGSELFGHERGAFTGAHRQHQGAFERADGGTIFLDEIGDLPAPLQAALIGVLQRKRFRRLGGETDISVNVRIVSATHRDLRTDVNKGRFRLDLYYRIAGVVLRMPALRERAGDIPFLCDHFLEEMGETQTAAEIFSPETMRALSEHHWAGNVRELRHVIEAAVAMGEQPAPGVFSLPERDTGEDMVAQVFGRSYKTAREAVLGDFERRYLADLLERSDGNVSRAAREANMDRSNLIRMLKRRGLR